MWIHHPIKIADFLPKSKNINAKKCTNWRFGHKIERNFGVLQKLLKKSKLWPLFMAKPLNLGPLHNISKSSKKSKLT